MGKRKEKKAEDLKIRLLWVGKLKVLMHKQRFRDYAAERYCLDNIVEEAIVCDECDRRIVFNDYCEDCYFKCEKCCYYFRKATTEHQRYEDANEDDLYKCIFCLEMEESIRKEEEEAPPDVKEPEVEKPAWCEEAEIQ